QIPLVAVESENRLAVTDLDRRRRIGDRPAYEQLLALQGLESAELRAERDLTSREGHDLAELETGFGVGLAVRNEGIDADRQELLLDAARPVDRIGGEPEARTVVGLEGDVLPVAGAVAMDRHERARRMVARHGQRLAQREPQGVAQLTATDIRCED